MSLTNKQESLLNVLINEKINQLEFVLENEILTDDERENFEDMLNTLHEINLEDI